MPTRGLSEAVKGHRDLSPEPRVESEDPARGAGTAVAAATFGAGAIAGAAAGAAVGAAASGGKGGKRAVAAYDYEKAEDNELELREGEFVTDIDMVDEDWWMGTNSRGEQGLFPSNYVELVEDETEKDAGAGAPPPLPSHPTAEQEPPAGPPQPVGNSGPTATALYDYEAAEENELSFPEDATIINVVSSI
jgi:hypothetical protein